MSDVKERLAVLEESTTDLLGQIRIVLRDSEEPLTLAKVRAALPPPFRALPLEVLAQTLQRHVAANVLVEYPRHRSARERYWDRPMHVHLEHLLHSTLGHGPLTWSKIRKRLPAYAKRLAESVLEEQLAKGKLFRHPPATSRMGPRFGLEPPDPRPYLQAEFASLMARCEQLGLARPLVRAALLDLLRAEEWAPSGGTSRALPHAINYDYVPSRD